MLFAVGNEISSGAPTTPTVSGGGITTWTQVATVVFQTNYRLTIFRALQASPGASAAATIDFGGVQQLHCYWSVSEYSGIDTGGTNGANAVRNPTTNTGSSTSPNVTLPAFADAANGTYGAFAYNDNTPVPSAGSGFTAIHTQQIETETLFTEWRADNDTSVDCSLSTSKGWGGIALEIVAPSGTPVSAADSFLGTDTSSLTAAITASDAVAGAESSSLAVALTAADAVAFSDASTLVAAITASDAVVFTDTAQPVAIAFAAADSFVGADASVALTVAIATSDAVAFSDTAVSLVGPVGPVVLVVPLPTPIKGRPYRYLVGDLLGNLREEIPFSNVSYAPELNGPGSFEGTLPLTHPKATRANLEPAATSIWVERQGTLVWGGILWLARASGQSVTFSGSGWWSYFRSRLVRVRKEYANADQADIVRDLISYAQAQDGGSVGMDVNAPATGVLRTQTYEAYERKFVGAAIEELAALDDGFEFAVDVFFDPAGRPAKRFNLSYPQRGRDLSAVWELAANMEDLPEWTIDGTRVANLIDVTGAGEGDDQLLQTAQITNRGSYPLLEDVLSFRDVDDASFLYDRANAEVLTRQKAPETISAPVRPTPETEVGAWGLGDVVTAKASLGYLQILGRYKIVGARISVTDEGAERVVPTLASVS